MWVNQLSSLCASNLRPGPVNTNWGLGPVNTNWGPGPVNTRWGPGPVNINWMPGPVNTNWGPGPGAGAKDQGQSRGPIKGLGAGKYKHPFRGFFFRAEVILFNFRVLDKSVKYLFIICNIFLFYLDGFHGK